MPEEFNSDSGKILRRHVLTLGATGLSVVLARVFFAGCDSQTPIRVDSGTLDSSRFHQNRKQRSLIAEMGPLESPDENGVRLATGFKSRIVAETGKPPTTSSSYLWHNAPDGGAVFEKPDGGWIYVSNSEYIPGGAGALSFDSAGKVHDAYRILDGTAINCAGGRTPWGTWLSCEEHDGGLVYECDPFGKEEAVVRPRLGRFAHEAVAIDPRRKQAYLTEDRPNGRLYRFTSTSPKQTRFLDEGVLEAMVVSQDGSVQWMNVPDPLAESKNLRDQTPGATAFDGGEGIWFFEDQVVFSTKGDNRIWLFDIEEQKVFTIYDVQTSTNPILTGVDNITVSKSGDVLVAEDGGDLEIVAILPDGNTKPIVQVPGHTRSEITGPAFDPSGTRLYFSSQRGKDGQTGITFEVEGPFHEKA